MTETIDAARIVAILYLRNLARSTSLRGMRLKYVKLH